MTRINKLLVEDLPADKFVTFVVAVLDPDAAQVQMLSAGGSTPKTKNSARNA